MARARTGTGRNMPRLDAEQRADNRHRAERGAEALNRYREEWDRGESDHTALTDLLADLMHCAGVHRVPFESALDLARTHYSAERAGVL